MGPKYKEKIEIDGCHGFGFVTYKNSNQKSYQSARGDYERKPVSTRGEREDIIAFLERIAKEVREDPEVAARAEELQRESVLTEEELKRRITI
ncbi:MAG: hypothetical protein DRP10_01875 [Candidatus Aenigmatarchaeota archaeon]|nr:MAG: hypothetical protein DRP10_01875 [Candidatus Aenigmarchaeota archaeon]